MKRPNTKLIFIACLILACSCDSSTRNLEDEEIDECIEFITDIIPVRLENLKKPIDFKKELIPLGDYRPKYKYEFKVCKEDDLNDCVLRYADTEDYVVKPADKEYKKQTDRYELHGRTIYRTKAFVFKYKSVKLRLKEGLSEDGKSCKEGYMKCGKFKTQDLSIVSILCFPEGYDCPIKEVDGGTKSGTLPVHIELYENTYLNYGRYTEDEYILSLFSGFRYIPLSQRDNIYKLPFDFTFNTSSSKVGSIFGVNPLDLRDIFKENNIYCHYLDFYLKGVPKNANTTFSFQLSARFDMLKDIPKKCNIKKEEKEEYEFTNFDDDCLTMIEHIEPTRANGTEKLYERNVFKLADYIPEYKYEHILCKTANKSDCKYEYSDDSEYKMMYYDRGYEVMNTTDISNTAKPIYLYQQHAFKYDKINIKLKEWFDINLYKCKDGYRACAKIDHHPWATLLCVPDMNYCPFNNIIGDSYMGMNYEMKLYPYNFGFGGIINFYYGRYQMNETLNYVVKSIYLRNGIYDFDEKFPFHFSTWYRGLSNIIAWKNRVYNLEKIFTENGVPTNYVKFYYPDDNILLSRFDDRQTRMYLGAEKQYFRDLDLKCEESSTNNEVILYAVWRDKDGKTGDPVTDNEPKTDKTDGKKNNGNKDDEDYDYEEELELDGSSMLNLSILLFISLLLY